MTIKFSQLLSAPTFVPNVSSSWVVWKGLNPTTEGWWRNRGDIRTTRRQLPQWPGLSEEYDKASRLCDLPGGLQQQSGLHLRKEAVQGVEKDVRHAF